MKKNTLYTYLIILAAIGVLASIEIAPFAISAACFLGMIIILSITLRKSGADKYRDVLFSYDSFCALYLDKSYDEIRKFLHEQGIKSEANPDVKTIEIALLCRLVALKRLEEKD